MTSTSALVINIQKAVQPCTRDHVTAAAAAVAASYGSTLQTE